MLVESSPGEVFVTRAFLESHFSTSIKEAWLVLLMSLCYTVYVRPDLLFMVSDVQMSLGVCGRGCSDVPRRLW